MYISGLSQNECDELITILDAEGIVYTVSIDEELIKLNEAQKNDTLAHYLPGRVSTNLIRIQIEPSEFAKISENSLHLMKELGHFSDNIPHPSEFEVYNEDNPEYLREHQLKKARFLNLVLITTTAICFATYLLLSLWDSE